MLTKIVLYGDLEDFGKEWELDVHSPAEAVRAINANAPGFLDRLQGGKYSILVLPADANSITTEDDVTVITDELLELPTSNKQVLHFVPFEEGDAFTAAAWVYFYIGSSGIAGAVALATIAAVVVFAAVTFALITVADMLMPSPPGMDQSKSDPSYAFSGPVNTSRQGGTVPVLYGGPLLVGSQVIGHSIVTEGIGSGERLKSRAHAEIVDAISEGEIEGFAGADLESSVYFDDVPAKVAGTEQFEGFEVAFLTGTQDQNAEDLNLAVNSSATSVHVVNVQVKKDRGPTTRLTQDPNVGSLTITVYFPALFRTRESNPPSAREVKWRVNIKGTGLPDYVVVANEAIFGRADDGYYQDHTYTIKPAYGTAPFLIQVQRLSQDDPHSTVHDDMYWSTWAEHVKSNLSYPNTSYAVTKLDAEFFSSLPVRGFLMKGLKIRIPNNYDPITHVYSGLWDGGWKLDAFGDPLLTWTNNPAWIFYDLATHARYGLGQYLDDTLIDKWALYTIAKYCDGLVNDGYGGTEQRFVCNLYLQNAGEALQVLRDLASSFRSIMFWAGGELKVHQDSPSATQAQFTPSNVIGGNFTYSGTPKHLRTTVALVTWTNPDDSYNSWIEYVEDEEGIRLYGINETSITAVGCTSRGQAHRVGKYALLMNRLLTDSCTFKTGLDGTQSLPGHVVKVVDPLHNQSDQSVGGRIASTTNLSAVVLDRPVTIEVGETYHLTVTMPDEQAEGLLQSDHAVTNGAGTVTPPSTITLSTPMPSTPVDGAVWTLTKDSESERLYRLLSVVDEDTTDGGFFQLSGVRYIPSAITDADDPGDLEPPDLPGEDNGISAPTSLRLEEGLGITSEGVPARYIDCTWGAPPAGFLHHYQVTVEHEYGPDIVGDVTEPNYHIADVQAGLYSVYVRAINVVGQISTAVTASLIVNELAPVDLLSITGLELKGQGNDVEFLGPSAEFEWRLTSALAGDIGDQTFGGDTGIPDPWFMDYEITMYDQYGEELRVEHVTDRSYTYTLDRNVEDGGPNRVFEIGVTARDVYNRKTAESFLQVYNPPPVGYTNVLFTTGIQLIIAKFTPPPDPDFTATRIYVSELSDFTPDVLSNLAYEGDATTAYIGDLPAVQYYVKLEGVDAFGPSGVYSQTYPVTIYTVNRIQEAVAGQIQEGWLYQSLNDRIDLIDRDPFNLWDRVLENETSISTLEQSSFTSLQTFYQNTDPQDDVPAPVLSEGDLWIDTASGDTIKRWNGAAWDALESGGNQVFYGDGPPDTPFTGQTPDPATLVTGDYWIDTHDYADGNGPANTPWMWNGTIWVNISEGLLQATASSTTTIIAKLADPATNASGLSAYVDDVQANVTINDGLISANASQVTYLTAQIDDPDNPLSTSLSAQYLRDLNVQVYDAGGLVSANADSVSTLQVVVDKKVTTYRQAADPITNVPTPTLVDGDLWIKTDDQNHMFRYQAAVPTGWKDVRDASVSGTTTWVANGVPDPNDSKYTTGDVYYQIDDNYRPWRFDGSTPVWTSVRDTSATGVTTYVGSGVPDNNGAYNTGDLYFDQPNNFRPYRYDTAAWVDITGTAGVQTYYSPAQPTGGTYNIGDLWFETDQGNQVYRYDGTTPWLNIQDADIAAALALAQVGVDDALAAQQTADGKIVTFYQSTTPTGASEGDFWVDTTLDGNSNPLNLLKRYTSTVWVAVQDQEVQDALTAAGDAQSTADGKIITFYQDAAPADNVSSDGDLWFDTNDSNHAYRYDPTANPKWQSVKDLSPSGLENYFQDAEPTGGVYTEGDMWFETDNDNHPHIYDTGAWVSVKDTSVTGVDTFYQDTAPLSGMVIGDLWFETDNNNQVSRFTGSKGLWQVVTDGDFSGIIPWVQTNKPSTVGKYEGDLWLDTDDGNRPWEFQSGAWVDISDIGLDTIRITAAVAVEQSARIQQDGLAFAEYTVKVDVNGHIAGIGLGVSGGQSGPIRSEIVMLADRFSIGYPTIEYVIPVPGTPSVYTQGTWLTPSQTWIDANGINTPLEDGTIVKKWPYVYKQTAALMTVVSGEPPWHSTVGTSINYGGGILLCQSAASTTPFIVGTFNAGTEQTPNYKEGVIISNAYIGSASIDYTHILDATITSAKIALAAINEAHIEDASITGAKIVDASITNAKIGQTIQSNDYVVDTSGWKLDKTTGFEVNSGNFNVDSAGNVLIKSADTGERMEIQNDVLKVFDASGTLRVQLGDLTA